MTTANDSRTVTNEEVAQILRLVDQLERSGFDFLRLEVGGLKLSVGKGGVDFADHAPAAVPVVAAAPAAQAPAAPAAASPAPAPAAPAVAAPAPSAAEGTPIKAPIIGRFYAQPEPGAPLFVEIGQQVEADTTVGLIEVMKVFNAVRAGVKGTITHVAVENAQFVEYGQTLFLVRPEGA